MKKLAFLLLFLLVAIPCSADIIYVKQGGTGSGTSWADAYGDLQDGLDDADPCDVIWVAEGTYYPTELIDPCDPRTAMFQMINGVALYGGFPDMGNPNMSDRDPNQYETILSGDLLGNDNPATTVRALLDDPNRADNCYHVFYHQLLDTTTILDGLTITSGNANGSGEHRYGGGMYNYRESSPTVTNCTFTGNSADAHGGGMRNYYISNSMVTNCTFAGNSAGSAGGGMHNSSSSPTVTGCTFTGNSADYIGGGMRNYYGSPTVADCTFTDNFASNWGGGMCNKESSLTVTNCTFTGNSSIQEGGGGMSNCRCSPTVINCTFTYNSSDRGGGMYNYIYSSPTVAGCTFTGNSADSGAGMHNYNDSSPTVTGCTFTVNSASWYAGGMMNNRDCSPTVINCTFTDNSARICSGGMENFSHSSPTVTNCTFTGNSVDLKGGGMHNGWSNPTVTNCTFSGNSAGEVGGGMWNREGSSPTVTNCTFSGNSAGEVGGGMYNWDSSSPTVTNCTFAGNSAPSGNGIACDSDEQLYPSTVQLANCILWNGGDEPNEIGNLDGSTITISYSDVRGGLSAVYDPNEGVVWGTGNIDTNPNFVSGPSGDYYLSQVAAGQNSNSPCVNAGSDTAVNLGMDEYTTRTDQVTDAGVVDMGFHYVPVPFWTNVADLDKDWSVDLDDVLIMALQWLQAPTEPSADIAPDEPDNFVDNLDFGVIQQNWLWPEQ